MMNPAYPPIGAGLASLGHGAIGGCAPASEVGQIQIAISSLNNAIEQACENQQTIEVRLNPVLLILPQGKDGTSTSQPEPAICELGENIKRLQQKVDYLVSRQWHVLQTVQL